MSNHVDPAAAGNRLLARYRTSHFGWQADVGAAKVPKPVRAQEPADLHALVVTGASDSFCSGGDMYEIIGPPDAAECTQTADAHARDRRSCQRHTRPLATVVAAIDGVCAGAIVTMGCDLRTLDVFRTSVAAAALGCARRALDEGLQRAITRRMFGGVLADFQLKQVKLAQATTHHRARIAARPEDNRSDLI